MSERAFPIIYVDDVPAAGAFYESLGFSQTYQFPAEGEPDYVTMSRADSSIGIGDVGAAGEDCFGFWVYVDDVDIAFEQLPPRTQVDEVTAGIAGSAQLARPRVGLRAQPTT